MSTTTEIPEGMVVAEPGTIPENIIQKDKELADAVTTVDGQVKTLRERQKEASAERDRFRWEQIKCPHGPQFGVREYARAVNAAAATIAASITSWQSVHSFSKTVNTCSYGDDHSTVLRKMTEAEIEAHRKANRRARVGVEKAVIAEEFARVFGGSPETFLGNTGTKDKPWKKWLQRLVGEVTSDDDYENDLADADLVKIAAKYVKMLKTEYDKAEAERKQREKWLRDIKEGLQKAYAGLDVEITEKNLQDWLSMAERKAKSAETSVDTAIADLMEREFSAKEKEREDAQVMANAGSAIAELDNLVASAASRVDLVKRKVVQNHDVVDKADQSVKDRWVGWIDAAIADLQSTRQVIGGISDEDIQALLDSIGAVEE